MNTHYRVYFIRRRDTQEIKIGISGNIPKRLRNLQAMHGSPLELMGSVQGDGCAEYRIHQAFADCRLMGEWFRENPRLLAYIERVTGPPSAWARVAIDPDRVAARHIRETLREIVADYVEPDGAHLDDPEWIDAFLKAQGVR